MCLKRKVLASLQVSLDFFFFTFPKNWVVRAMGNETVYGDGLTRKSKTIKNDVLRFSLRKMLPVKCPLVSLKAS